MFKMRCVVDQLISSLQNIVFLYVFFLIIQHFSNLLKLNYVSPPSIVIFPFIYFNAVLQLVHFWSPICLFSHIRTVSFVLLVFFFILRAVHFLKKKTPTHNVVINSNNCGISHFILINN